MTGPAEHRVLVNIDDDVELLRDQIEALQQLGRQEAVSDGEIYDFSIRWGTALAGRLPRLVHFSSQNRLDEAAEEEFESLCDELRKVSELAAQFGLAEPQFTPEPERRTRSRGMTLRRRLIRRK